MQHRNALGLVIAIKYVHIYIYYRVCHTTEEKRLSIPRTE